VRDPAERILDLRGNRAAETGHPQETAPAAAATTRFTRLKERSISHRLLTRETSPEDGLRGSRGAEAATSASARRSAPFEPHGVQSSSTVSGQIAYAEASTEACEGGPRSVEASRPSNCPRSRARSSSWKHRRATLPSLRRPPGLRARRARGPSAWRRRSGQVGHRGTEPDRRRSIAEDRPESREPKGPRLSRATRAPPNDGRGSRTPSRLARTRIPRFVERGAEAAREGLVERRRTTAIPSPRPLGRGIYARRDDASRPRRLGRAFEAIDGARERHLEELEIGRVGDRVASPFEPGEPSIGERASARWSREKFAAFARSPVRDGPALRPRQQRSVPKRRAHR